MMARSSSILAAGVFGVLIASGAAVDGAAAAGDAWLPLGDGYITTEPRRGNVFVCQTRFGGGGAHREGDWIRGDRWNPDLKPTVDGSVSWPNARIDIAIEGADRVVRANNLPTHPTGNYPVSRGDDAWQYDRNPNRITEQNVLLRLPANPKPAAQPSCVPMGMIGFAVTGVAIYNALDGLGRDAAAHEILDACDGHPERDGQYHYHGPSPCTAEGDRPLGYALDGFGIYGVYGEDGNEIHNADLDACHGHVETVTWNGRRQRIYHYHMTREYPYTLGCYTGTPVSFGRRGGGPGGGGPAAGGVGGGPRVGAGAESGVGGD
ncbi:YHYH protein, partial [Thalassobaculum sp.]|uniref:YHYH protein n=1 Tax=Thalassobaculum sp. TaxID=2022740 RepID=UPI0032ECB9EE